jgi:hypothetical protein
MRQPDTNILQAVIAALPDDRLRPLLLELLGVVSAAPLADTDGHKPTDAVVSTTPAPPAKHAGGRPRGSPNKAKATAGATGAAQARHLAALPGREEIIRAVIAGELTQVAGAKKIGCTAKTLGTWVTRYRSEHKPVPEQQLTPTGGEGATPAPAKRPSGPVGETPAQRAERLARHAARQRERDAERRQQRDAERAAQAAQMGLPIEGNGNGSGDAGRLAISAARPTLTKTSIEPDPAEAERLAVRLWQKASALNPQNPWRPVASEFGLNAALALDHHRSGTLPPVAAAAITRFVEASAS